jgi:hypothetical protein
MAPSLKHPRPPAGHMSVSHADNPVASCRYMSEPAVPDSTETESSRLMEK